MSQLLARRRAWIEAFGWALALIGFVSFIAFLWQATLRDGGFAYDRTVLLLPYLWVSEPELRRPMVIGATALAAAFAIHALFDPAVWRDYISSLGQQAGSVNDASYVGDQLLVLVPSTLGDFVVRLAIGTVLLAVAIRYRADWLAFTAAAIAVPTLWVARLAALVAVPRMLLEERVSRAGSAADGRDATRR